MSERRKTITVKQYERLMDWEPILRAAGLYSTKYDALTVYLLAGAIMHDEIVSARACELPHPDGLAMTPDHAYETVLVQMTDEERAELKARIVAKFNRKAPPSH